MAVYESYYGCVREPFSLSPDPGFLFAAAPHREALAQLRYLIEERKGFAVVTGEVGTGKTMLLRTVIESVGSHVQTGYVFNPPPTTPALFAAIAEELGLSLEGVANPAMALNRHFLSTYETGGTVVLIFDEAQALPIDVLEQIRLLTNIETPRAKLVQVILAGQSELDPLIDSTELRALRQRLVFRYALAPLDQKDTHSYIAARMAAAGASRSPFTEAACESVHRYSGGIPRLINVICDNALLSGYAAETRTIDAELIDEAASDLKIGRKQGRPGDPRLTLVPSGPANAETPTRATRSRGADQEYMPEINAAVAATASAPRTRFGLREPLRALEFAPSVSTFSRRAGIDLQEWLSSRDEVKTSAGPVAWPEALAQQFMRPRLRVGTLLQGSQWLRLLIALSIASLVVALVLGTLVALEGPRISSVSTSRESMNHSNYILSAERSC
jgi:general secretion pathway protein A